MLYRARTALGASGIEAFVAAYERWQLADGAIHPHPYFRQQSVAASNMQ
jgi:hypothetical protein